MKKKNYAQTIGILIIFAVVLLFAFFRLTEKTANNQDTGKEQTELEILLEYDFEDNYPKTVRDVVKLYFRYLDYMYTEDITDEDAKALNSKMRNLYDAKLNDYNDEDEQFDAMIQEIAGYEDEKVVLVGYTIAEASQIVYDTVDDTECAKVGVTMNLRVGTASAGKEQVYLLKKNLEGHWKIYGWTVIEEDDSEAE